MPNDKVQIVIGVDPGITGGICIMLGEKAIVLPPPIVKVKINNKIRSKYDIQAIYHLFKPYQGQSVVFGLEKVGTRPGESPIAAYSFGEGSGYWKMVAVCCEFKLVEIRSQEWKAFYPQLLTTPEILEIRESVTALKGQLKAVNDKKLKTNINKDISTLSRKLKEHAKDAARRMAGELYPDIAENFKRKCDDGKAESVLIARFCKEKYGNINDLV